MSLGARDARYFVEKMISNRDPAPNLANETLLVSEGTNLGVVLLLFWRNQAQM